MDCILQYIQVQLFVYFNERMIKYCIVKKCINNSSCKNVSFFFQNTKKLCMARPFKVGKLQSISLKLHLLKLKKVFFLHNINGANRYSH